CIRCGAARGVRQSSRAPRRHQRHSPQGERQPSTTLSPGATFSTPSPTASTTPAPSCPSSTGRGWLKPVSTTCRSEWQTPLASIATRSSPGPGSSRSSSSTPKRPSSVRTTPRSMRLAAPPPAERREQLLVPPLLVRHAFLDWRLLAPRGHRLNRPHDEEEDSGRDREEL